MRRPPCPYGQGLITANLLYRILFVGGIGAATVFVLFSWRVEHASVEEARALAVNALVLFAIFYLLSACTLNDAIWHKRYWQDITPSLCAIALVLFLQLGFTYWPLSQQVFQVGALPASDWLLMLIVTSPILLLMEIEKAWARHRRLKKYYDAAPNLFHCRPKRW
jgi:magnesium-transporting ATPase (P-type)